MKMLNAQCSMLNALLIEHYYLSIQAGGLV
jgi:hypothetical protein